jgi:hypothetical protein
MKWRCIIGLIICLTLNACSTMNTSFSCNQTADDHCLSIEEVDAMTEVTSAHVKEFSQVWYKSDTRRDHV